MSTNMTCCSVIAAWKPWLIRMIIKVIWTDLTISLSIIWLQNIMVISYLIKHFALIINISTNLTRNIINLLNIRYHHLYLKSHIWSFETFICILRFGHAILETQERGFMILDITRQGIDIFLLSSSSFLPDLFRLIVVCTCEEAFCLAQGYQKCRGIQNVLHLHLYYVVVADVVNVISIVASWERDILYTDHYFPQLM